MLSIACSEKKKNLEGQTPLMAQSEADTVRKASLIVVSVKRLGVANRKPVGVCEAWSLLNLRPYNQAEEALNTFFLSEYSG